MAESTGLTVPDSAAIKEELGLGEDKSLVKLDSETTEQVSQQAGSFVDKLLDFKIEDVDLQEGLKGSIDGVGANVQKEAAHRSQMLQRPINELSQRGEDGGEVAKSLIDLKMHVEDLDPSGIDLGKPGALGRALGKIPIFGSKLKRYFAKYEAAQTVIGAIMNSLENGKKQLTRDNGMLAEDQKAMRDVAIKLQKVVEFAQQVDQKIGYKLEREIEPDDPRRQFIQEELLFPLRQRIMDVQQQLVVNQQGVLAIEIIRRNNKELIRGVDRALNVTVNALSTAVTVALALANQEIVLDKISAVNKVTSNLIAATAARLRTQGAEIHKQASSSMLEMEKLKSAFSDITAALDDISTYRQEALPKMAQSILEFDDMAQKGEDAIQKMEKGNRAAPAITMDEDLGG